MRGYRAVMKQLIRTGNQKSDGHDLNPGVLNALPVLARTLDTKSPIKRHLLAIDVGEPP
jgi:hypothetical protein